jgi:hypothetical protein
MKIFFHDLKATEMDRAYMSKRYILDLIRNYLTTAFQLLKLFCHGIILLGGDVQ